jgi:hypothetical protein
MIICNLKGGLGNQMFQYACGRALSEKCNQQLKLSTESFKGDKLRNYALGVFDIPAEVATKEEIKKIKYPFGALSKITHLIANKAFKKNRTVHYDPKQVVCKKDIFLDGYWQTEKYFSEIRELLLKDLQPQNPLSKAAAEAQAAIQADPTATSIHFRRGDYVGNKIHDTQDEEYFLRAISEAQEKIENPKLYVFSDEIDWVKKNINLPEGSVYVSSPEIQDHEEILLMSKCKHNIIANSSFSWWGAWLNTNADKIVIAPKKWINRKESDFRDTIPENWIRV